MSLFGAIDNSASGLTAERLRMDVISNNLANANTTRTAEGGAYKRKVVVFEPRNDKAPTRFATMFNHELQMPRGRKPGNGVRAVRIETDTAHQCPLVYDPGHPDANARGYVERPNVNIVAEMTDMITATRAYDANVTTMNATKAMMMKALDIGK